MYDYLEMLNQRDGGIGGVKIVLRGMRTGYDTKKGVECYEAVKRQEPGDDEPVFDRHHPAAYPARFASIRSLCCPWPMVCLASADGSVFPWIFNPPATCWDGVSVMVTYMAQQLGGLDKLKGKKLGLIHLDAPSSARKPIPLLEGPRQGIWLRAEALSHCRRRHAEPRGHLISDPPRQA